MLDNIQRHQDYGKINKMEQVGRAIQAILLANTNVTSLLTGVNLAAIYQGLAPQHVQNTLYIRFLVVDVEPHDTKDGPSTLDSMILNIDCFGTVEADADLLNNYVRLALDRYPHGQVNGVELHGVRFLRSFMAPDNADGSDKYQFTSAYKFRVGRSAFLVGIPINL